jgi:PmbA protein
MSHTELCKEAIATAQKAGAKEAEAFMYGDRTVNVDIERGEIKTCSDLADMGMGIRAITDGKIGFAYTNVLTREEVEKTAIQAAAASQASLKDKNWRQLPESRKYPTVDKTFDKRILEVASDKVVELCQQAIASSTEMDKRVMAALGGAQVSSLNLVCANSNGVEVEDKGTFIACGLGAMARSETQVSPMCFEFKVSRTYEIDPNWVGNEAARLATQSLNVGKPEAGKYPVLLDPFALQEILTHTLIESAKGDTVYRGRSKLKDKEGKQIAAENVSLYDDGTLPGGMYSGKTDFEGIPRQKTPIIEKGTLHGFIYDNYWARLAKAKSTGNAGRGGGALSLPPYCMVPSISPTNIRLKEGTASEDELVREVKDGYYVRSVQGAHQSNPDTGDFSVAITPAWRIMKGEIQHAVKGAMISGNIYDLLNKIGLIGKEPRQVGTFIAPKVVVTELNVVSK